MNIPVYASKLEDLSDLIDSNLYYDEAIKALSVDEKVLAIPRDISNLVLYVNKDIIKNSPQNWTLEEMLLIAKENTNQNHFGISFEDDVYFMTPYLSYFGEELKESYNLKDSEGYTFYLNLRDKYKVAPKKYQIGSSTLAQMFLDEKIAMYLSGRWMFPKIKEKAHFDWEIMLFPVGKSLQLCDSSGWAIAKDSEHKEAAFKFIKFLSQDNNLSYMTQTGLIVPAQKAIAKSLANEEHAEYLFLKAIEISKKTNVFKNYKKYIDKINLGIRE